MEQVDLTWALLGLKELCFCRWLAATKVLLHELRRRGGTAGAHRGAQRLSLCSPAPASLDVPSLPAGRFCSPRPWAELWGDPLAVSPRDVEDGAAQNRALCAHLSVLPAKGEPSAADGNPWLQESPVSPS